MKYHKMLKKAGLIASVFLLYFTTGALCANYYVDTAGKDQSGCGDEGYGADACATPQYVIDTYSPARGDTINIDDGTYGEYGTTSGIDYIVYLDSITSGSGYLTLKARNDNQVVFDMESTDARGDLGYGALVWGSTGIKFVGINFTRVKAGGARLAQSSTTKPSNDIWFLKCKFYKIGNNDTTSKNNLPYGGILGQNNDVGASSPILVDKCTFYDIGKSLTGTYKARWDWAIYANGNFTITNSLFYDLRSSAVQGRGGTSSGLKFYNNVISNINDTMATNVDGWDAHFIAVASNHLDSLIVANNIFINAPRGYDGWLSTIYAEDIYYYNNATTSDDGASADNIGVALCAGSICPSTGHPFGANSNNTLSISNFTTQSTDPTKGDFSLTTAASDLLDQGNATYAPPDDYLGMSRPHGSADDIGAYDGSHLSSSKSRPRPPEGLVIINP